VTFSVVSRSQKDPQLLAGKSENVLLQTGVQQLKPVSDVTLILAEHLILIIFVATSSLYFLVIIWTKCYIVTIYRHICLDDSVSDE